MANSHSIIFFGQNAALLVLSVSKNDPYTYLYCFKKTISGAWERPYCQGDVFKCSLEDLIMIIKVLSRSLTVWSSSPDSTENDLKITFEWEDDSKNDLWISLGNYMKVLSISETEIFNLLLSHILKEKICYATVLYKENTKHTIKHAKFSRVLKKRIERKLANSDWVLYHDIDNIKKNNFEYNDKIDEKGLDKSIIEESTRETTPIKGTVKGETEKALLICFKSGEERWIPKSTIRCHYSANRDVNQTFLIETWILQKIKINLT